MGIGNTNPTAFLHVTASTANSASLRINSGSTPTTPNDGDVWYDGGSLKMQQSGNTVNFATGSITNVYASESNYHSTASF